MACALASSRCVSVPVEGVRRTLPVTLLSMVSLDVWHAKCSVGGPKDRSLDFVSLHQSQTDTLTEGK